ncbi:MAG: pilus assembly protein [Phycisphaerae bacterium]|nr:pilus assembly protein [Phycisphaerae bacterium]
MKVNKNKNRCRRGLETVEAALLLPIVMMVTFGALKYGWIFLKYQQITNITRHAARVASLATTTSSDVYTLISDRIAAAGIKNYNADWVTYEAATGIGQQLKLTIEVPATKETKVDILPLGSWILTPDYLTATATMSKEG